ncbi:MAG: sulfatase-like hydrolase/transferase [Candidatus Brocadiia bacterium]
MSTERPNILFLMSDEHRPDVVGYEGNDVVRTPTLDWLAETGTVFSSAYTPSPICVPGRQCMMSGQLPESCGCRSYGEDLPPFSMTFARQFARYAYRTVCSGKLHHMGQDQMQGWTNRLAPDAAVNGRYIEGLKEEEAARYEPPPGTGKWTNEKEVKRAGIACGRYQQFDRMALDSARMFVRRHFLDPEYDRPGSHQPTLLKLSLLQPHYPFFTDEEKFTYYLNRVPVFDEAPPIEHPKLATSQGGYNVDLNEREIRRATAAYYGMVETADGHFGSLLESLEHAGEDLDEWIIIYTSDHGEMLGEHGIWEKTQFFEGSARVPLIIRWPERFEPSVVEQNVNLCDLFATLCDLAGIEPPDERETVGGAGLDSRSLVPLMDGRTDQWLERHENESLSQVGNSHLMIKRDDLKYLYFGEMEPPRREVLFDLSRDPRETVNLVGNDKYEEQMEQFRERRKSYFHGGSGG